MKLQGKSIRAPLLQEPDLFTGARIYTLYCTLVSLICSMYCICGGFKSFEPVRGKCKFCIFYTLATLDLSYVTYSEDLFRAVAAVTTIKKIEEEKIIYQSKSSKSKTYS
jgi:hypothetical protein